MSGVKLTEGQIDVLSMWLDGTASPYAKGVRGSLRMRYIRQCVRKGLLETISGLPFAGRRQRTMTLELTPAGRLALEKTEGGE